MVNHSEKQMTKLSCVNYAICSNFEIWKQLLNERKTGQDMILFWHCFIVEQYYLSSNFKIVHNFYHFYYLEMALIVQLNSPFGGEI